MGMGIGTKHMAAIWLWFWPFLFI